MEVLLASPFLTQFTHAVLHRLHENELLEIVGDLRSISNYVAERLGGSVEGKQLISSLTKALVECPDVVELYADDDTLKELVTELPREVLHRGAP